MIECVIYENGSMIYNTDTMQSKYRTGVQEIARVYFNQDEIYENKKPNKVIWYLCVNNTMLPMIQLCFVSEASLNRYIKLNKKYLIENFGEYGKDYFREGFTNSHMDVQTV